MKNYAVPFYSNTPDDTHCFQASLKMVLKYFWPIKDFSWDELDKITAKQEGMWTWPMAGLCWLSDNNFEVTNIEDFDYELFAEQKERYLFDKYGAEIAESQIKNSNIDEEAAWANKFINEIKTEQRLPSIDEVKLYLDKGYLLMVNVNARSLTNREGYAGHIVLIKGYNDSGLIIHDPGLTPRENINVSMEQFMKGWDYPNEGSRNLMAIKFS